VPSCTFTSLMIDSFSQKHSTRLSYQAQRGVSFFLTVNQGCPKEFFYGCNICYPPVGRGAVIFEAQ
jgi:hypothetical protein